MNRKDLTFFFFFKITLENVIYFETCSGDFTDTDKHLAVVIKMARPKVIQFGFMLSVTLKKSSAAQKSVTQPAQWMYFLG